MKRLMAVLLLIVMLSGYSFTIAQGAELSANYSFNGFVTNESPTTLPVSGKNYRIYEYDKNEKGLLMELSRSASKFTVGASIDGDFVVSFDVMRTSGEINGDLTLVSQDKSFAPILFENNIIRAHNQKSLGGIAQNRMTKVQLVVKTSSQRYDVYINGNNIISDWYASTMNIQGISELVFSFTSNSGGSAIVIDNINVHTGDKLLKNYPVDAYNSESVELAEKRPVGDTVFVNNDFTTGVLMNEKSKENIMEIVKEPDGNDCFHMKKINESDMFANYTLEAGVYSNIVVEFDLKVADMKSTANFAQFKGGTKWSTNVLLQNGVITLCGKQVGNVLQTKWRNFAFAIDLDNEMIDAYCDDKLIMEDIPYATPLDGPVDTIRLRAPGNKNVCDIYIDNYKIYEGTEPHEIVEKEIVKDPSKTVFPKEDEQIKQLENTMAIHTKSGVFYDGEEKSLMDPAPYILNNRTMIPVRYVSEKLGVDVEYSDIDRTVRVGDNAIFTVGSNVVNIDGKDITMDVSAELVNDRVFLPFRVLCEQILDKKVLYDDTAKYNNGMIIISDNEYKLPADPEKVQELNDFLFYYRPKAEEIYNQYVKVNPDNSHPRLHINKAGFENLKKEIEIYPIKKKWADNIIKLADSYILSNNVPEYKTYDGVRLPSYSIGRTEVFGMAYQLTGNRKYVDAAWVQIEAVCSWPSWNPSHFLDVSNFLTGVAIGYDWMYDAWTDEQKKIMEEGIFRNGLDEADNWYLGLKGSKTVWPIADNNWNTSCNGAVMKAALVFMEIYPEICSRLVSNAMRGVEFMIYLYAPDGAWFEGTSYWGATTSAVGNLIDAMDSVLGHSFRIDKIGGLDTTADFILQMQTNYGAYNFADSELSLTYPAVLYWLSNKFNNPSVAASTLKNTNSESNEPLALYWLNPTVEANDINLPLDDIFKGDIEVASMRESWTDTQSTYAAFKAGETLVNHSHLDEGSFIFESMGERWAVDLGKDDYNLPNYWDTVRTRWQIMRMRAEGHNTVVINPDGTGIDQVLNTTAKITDIISKPRGAIGIVDMSEPYKNRASSYTRGFFLTDNRRSLVVRDEIALGSESEMHWMMYTPATEAEISDGSVVLKLNGKELKLTYITNASNAEVLFEDPLPLEGSPVTSGENQNLGYKRLRIKLTGKGKVNMTVKLTPNDMQGTDVSEYDKNISLWEIPDGEIPPKPAADMIYVDGEPISDFDPQTQTYRVKYTDPTAPVPTITAESVSGKVSIVNANNYTENTSVTVSSREDNTVSTTYKIVFKRDFSKMPTITPVAVTASAEPQPENPKESAIDNNFDTRWSSNGLTGHWIELDLGEVYDISNVLMGTYEGNARIFSFDILVSTNGKDYGTVFTGQTDGITVGEYEAFDIGTQKARYVRINCKGTSVGAWNSITELAVVEAK